MKFINYRRLLPVDMGDFPIGRVTKGAAERGRRCAKKIKSVFYKISRNSNFFITRKTRAATMSENVERDLSHLRYRIIEIPIGVIDPADEAFPVVAGKRKRIQCRLKSNGNMKAVKVEKKKSAHVFANTQLHSIITFE